MPPVISSMVSVPAFALAPKSPMAFSISAKLIVGVAHDGDDKAIGRADRDRDVEIIVIDDFVAIDLRIDRRNIARSKRNRLGEEAHETKPHAVLLLEQILVGRARFDHRAHVAHR